MTGVTPSPPVPDPEPGVRAAERLLADLRSEIARADAKAAVLVAALGVAAGVFGGLMARSEWAPARLSTFGGLAWWSGISALALALIALLVAVVPRYGTSTWAPGAPLSYFGDIQRAARGGHLADALAETERVPAAGAIAALTETSRIAARKHQWIRTGLIAFCVAVVLIPGSLLIG
ncbi:Pycsar system effector family protein [Streptomyces yerevanensis]|uniref:Pycsar system effector family protein n=1 Tax=Streptomyces yerevanensis TaxID=66378 RepID=UPI000525BEB1|nr:Pycsar system effector family protein [Streptomyces yerevanensis]